MMLVLRLILPILTLVGLTAAAWMFGLAAPLANVIPGLALTLGYDGEYEVIGDSLGVDLPGTISGSLLLGPDGGYRLLIDCAVMTTDLATGAQSQLAYRLESAGRWLPVLQEGGRVLRFTPESLTLAEPQAAPPQGFPELWLRGLAPGRPFALQVAGYRPGRLHLARDGAAMLAALKPAPGAAEAETAGALVVDGAVVAGPESTR